MKLKIENIERECVIMDAKGLFCPLEEGVYMFPLYIALAPAITEEEKSCGDVLLCPIDGLDCGFDSLRAITVLDELRVGIFRELIIEHFQIFECDNIEEYVEDVLMEFESHGVIIPLSTRKYVENKKYLLEEEIIKEMNERGVNHAD